MFCFLILSPYFLPFPHVLGTILLMLRLTKIFYFLSHFRTNVYVKLFTKGLNLLCSWARPNINIFYPFVIEVQRCKQYRRAGSVFYGSFQLQYSYEYANWHSFKNRSKWASVVMYSRRFSTAFRTATVKYTHRWLLPKCS